MGMDARQSIQSLHIKAPNVLYFSDIYYSDENKKMNEKHYLKKTTLAVVMLMSELQCVQPEVAATYDP